MCSPKLLCLPPIANTLRDLDMRFTWVCKNEEDPIKNEEARVVTTLFINFSDAQRQLTPKSVMKSCRNSNPSKLLWLVLLSARMKKIHPKNEGAKLDFLCFSH